MQRVVSKGSVITWGGREGGWPHGAVQHWLGTGLVKHLCPCKQQSPKKLLYLLAFTSNLVNSCSLLLIYI
jgi:hypothetical protein